MPEEHREQETIEGNDPETQPEIEKSEESPTPEEESRVPDRFKMEKEPLQQKYMTGDKTMYCTICNKQIEKYGRRKEDFKKPGWVFCPKHGWIQEGIYDKEVVSELPVRLSIEEVPEEHGEQETSLEEKESEILYEIEKPETFPMPEEKQRETDLSDERELRTADLPIGEINVVRNKSISIGIIFTVIFITLLLAFTLGYFAWKNSSSESLRIKSLRALVQKEGLTTQVQSQASTPPQKSILVERSTEEVKSDASAPPQEAVPQGGNAEPTEKIKVKPLQFRKTLHEIFTVQVGAFTDVSYAKSLKKRLDKKGYKIYITSSNLKKEGKIYKVWTGKFSNREKAETFAAKITKIEDIQTFVTLWKKQ